MRRHGRPVRGLFVVPEEERPAEPGCSVPAGDVAGGMQVGLVADGHRAGDGARVHDEGHRLAWGYEVRKRHPAQLERPVGLFGDHRAAERGLFGDAVDHGAAARVVGQRQDAAGLQPQAAGRGGRLRFFLAAAGRGEEPPALGERAWRVRGAALVADEESESQTGGSRAPPHLTPPSRGAPTQSWTPVIVRRPSAVSCVL